MGRLETNDWININNIIYSIYTIKNTEEMQRKFLERLKTVVEYDAADFCIASRDKSDSVESSVRIGMNEHKSVKFETDDYSKDIMYSGRSFIYRESDMVTEDKRVRTKAHGFNFSVQMILGTEGGHIRPFHAKNIQTRAPRHIRCAAAPAYGRRIIDDERTRR